MEADAIGYAYRYKSSPWTPWISTNGSGPPYTVTGLDIVKTYTFEIQAYDVSVGIDTSPSNKSSTAVVSSVSKPKQRIIQGCPVGWVRSDGFAGRTRRALIYEVKLEMELHNPISIYKPDWVAIYVHPDEGLENLDGWKLQVAIPYNHHREYLLTAENSVVVDAGFVEGGFAFIENPQENPFPMVGIGFTGSPAQALIIVCMMRRVVVSILGSRAISDSTFFRCYGIQRIREFYGRCCLRVSTGIRIT